MTIPQEQLVQEFIAGEDPDSIRKASNLYTTSVDGGAAIVSELGYKLDSEEAGEYLDAVFAVRDNDGRIVFLRSYLNGHSRQRSRIRRHVRRAIHSLAEDYEIVTPDELYREVSGSFKTGFDEEGDRIIIATRDSTLATGPNRRYEEAEMNMDRDTWESAF